LRHTPSAGPDDEFDLHNEFGPNMSAIEHCPTAALGGHVEAYEDCGHWRIAYNSCIVGNFHDGELASPLSD
jgi:Transposase zinc-binding domain